MIYLMDGYNFEIKRRQQKNIPYVTAVLIVINVIVFLFMEVIGDTGSTQFLYEHGGMYWPSIVEDRQWYRLITHMFVHSGGEHLLNNMFMLGILGYQIEKDYGPVKYLLTYFISGIGGAVVSAIVEMNMGEAFVSIGASGAVFGIFGVMLAMIFKNRRQMGEISALRLLILFVLMVFGNMEEGVDWMAHFGGAVIGVIMALILYRPKTNKRFNI